MERRGDEPGERVPPSAPDAEPADPPPFTPFRRESSTRLVDSPWCALRRDHVRLEDGHTQDYYVFEVSPAVVVVPVLPDGSLLTLWQYRYPLGISHWEIPAGRMDPGESPTEAAARELLEETGHRAARLTPLPGFHPINGISPHYAHPFVAHDCERVRDPAPEATERLSLHVMDEALVRRRLLRGDFTDAFTALALFHHFARRDAAQGSAPGTP